MLIATIAGVVVLCGYTGITAYQAWVMNGQLQEMRSGSTQTDQAIAASNRIATATANAVATYNRIADATAKAVEASDRLVAETGEAVAVSKRLAEATEQTSIQAADLAKSAAKSSTEAQRLSDLATRANDISQRALVGVQRAFMFAKNIDLEKVTNAQITGDVTGTKPIAWLARVKWENSGVTPTKDLVIDTNCLASFDPIERPWAVTASASAPEKMKVVMNGQIQTVFGPHSVDYGGSCPLSGVGILLHALGAIHFYVFGSAHYKDVLGEAAVHRTDFCFEMQLTGNPETGYFEVAGVPPLTSSAYRCKEHNCADGECEREDRELAARARSVPK